MITTTLSFNADKALSPDQHAYVVKTFNGLLSDLPTSDPEEMLDIPEHGTPAVLGGKKKLNGSVDYAVTFESSSRHTIPQEKAMVRVLTLACQYMPTEWTFSEPEEKPDCSLPVLTRSEVGVVSSVEDVCRRLPEEFRAYAQTSAYDRGHSAGEDECISIARGIVAALLPCIDAYAINITR